MAMQRLLLTQAEIHTLVAAMLERRERLDAIINNAEKEYPPNFRSLLSGEREDCTDILRKLRELQPLW